jgi:photosystem II stability/assembly factor-like uncharacterized protein
MIRKGRRQRLARIGALVLFLFAFGAPRGARANGAFPDEFSVQFPPDAPHRILIGANFGLLVSEDDGATWRYSCEPWIVAGSNAAVNPEASVSFYQVTADGKLLAAAVNITRSSDQACTWPIATGLQGQIISDIFASPSDATLVLAIVDVSSGSYLVASHDGAQSFDATRLRNENGELLTGIEIARSDPATMYATSLATSGDGATLLRSMDGGANWTPHTIPAAQGTQPRILAVDPLDKDTVYVRLLAALKDAIAITTDGGQNFQTLLEIDGRFTSFLRSTDGTLYAGTSGGQLHVRPPGAASFTARPAPHLRCLGQRYGEPKRIYACGDSVNDGYSLYWSEDGGLTFTPVMKFTDIQGPLSCSQVATNCAAHWERIKAVLGIGAVPDAGQGGGGGGGGGGTSPGGSSCATVGAGAATLLLLLAFSLRRRSRS